MSVSSTILLCVCVSYLDNLAIACVWMCVVAVFTLMPICTGQLGSLSVSSYLSVFLTLCACVCVSASRCVCVYVCWCVSMSVCVSECVFFNLFIYNFITNKVDIVCIDIGSDSTTWRDSIISWVSVTMTSIFRKAVLLMILMPILDDFLTSRKSMVNFFCLSSC